MHSTAAVLRSRTLEGHPAAVESMPPDVFVWRDGIGGRQSFKSRSRDWRPPPAHWLATQTARRMCPSC
jgi:hypothetical protein